MARLQREWFARRWENLTLEEQYFYIGFMIGAVFYTGIVVWLMFVLGLW